MLETGDQVPGHSPPGRCPRRLSFMRDAIEPRDVQNLLHQTCKVPGAIFDHARRSAYGFASSSRP